MKKKTIILFSIFAFFALSCNQPTRAQAQTADNEIEVVCEKTEKTVEEIVYEEIIFQNDEIEKPRTNELRIFIGSSFVSLSDIDRNLDSHTYFSDREVEDGRVFILSAEYRRQFLERTGISETDSVFLFDHFDDILFVFPVSDLDVFAALEVWAYPYNQPHPQYRYHIGFRMNEELFGRSRLVYVGKTHPFVRGGLTQMMWEEISSDDFPLDKAQLDTDFFGRYHLIGGEAYMFEWEHFRYYLQDLRWAWGHREGEEKVWSIHNWHLLVFDTRNNELVVERTFHLDERGGGLTESEARRWIQGQTGYLFQNQPPIIFGLDDIGCTRFIFLDPTVDDLWVLCDNRN